MYAIEGHPYNVNWGDNGTKQRRIPREESECLHNQT